MPDFQLLLQEACIRNHQNCFYK